MAVLMFFGDSITLGENDFEQGGWVDRLKPYFRTQNPEHLVFNLGIGGESTRGLKKRFEIECRARAALMQDNYMFLGYGANDLADRKGRRQVPVDEYESHLSHCIEWAQKRDYAVVLIAVLPISKEMDGVPRESGSRRENSQVAEYNGRLKKLSVEFGIPLIDPKLAFGDKIEEFLDDGLHPSSSGHELLSEFFKAQIEKLLKQ